MQPNAVKCRIFQKFSENDFYFLCWRSGQFLYKRSAINVMINIIAFQQQY